MLTRRLFLSLPCLAIVPAVPLVLAFTPRELPELPPARLTRDDMIDRFTAIERFDDRVERIWAHPRTAAGFRAVFGIEQYDQNYQGVLLDYGLAGTLWGAGVWTNEAIEEGRAELVGSDRIECRRSVWLFETKCSARKPADWAEVVMRA